MEKTEQSPISDGIRAAIRSCGRSPNQIAKEVKCSPQQLYNFLGGKRRLSQDLMDALAVALELEVRVRPKPSIVVEAALNAADSPDSVGQPHPVPTPQVIGKRPSAGEDKDQLAAGPEPGKQDDRPQQAPPEEPQAAQEPVADDQIPGGGIEEPTPPPRGS